MYTTDAPQIIEHASKTLSFTPHDCKWVPSSARFVALGSHPRNTGAIHIFELTPDETRLAHQVRPGQYVLPLLLPPGARLL